MKWIFRKCPIARLQFVLLSFNAVLLTQEIIIALYFSLLGERMRSWEVTRSEPFERLKEF